MKRKFKQAVVHIGLHKTGTTFIQQLMFDHCQWLEQHADIHYPDFSENHSIWLCSLFCQEPEKYFHNVRAGMHMPERVQQVNRERLARIEEGFAQTRASRLLLSAEDLSMLTGSEVQHFKEWLDTHAEEVTILAGIREPYGWSASLVQQMVKTGAVLDDLLQNPPGAHTMRERITPWLDAFGRHRLQTLDYNKAIQHKDGLITAFCNSVSIPHTFLQQADLSVRLNESWSQHGIQMLSELNKQEPMIVDGISNPMRPAAGVEMIERVQGDKFTLPPAVLKRVETASQSAVQWMNTQFSICLPPHCPAIKDADEGNATPAEVEQPHTLDEKTKLSIASIINQLSMQNEELTLKLRASQKQEQQVSKKAHMLRERLDKVEGRLNRFQKAIISWNKSSWLRRAFHKLRA